MNQTFRVLMLVCLAGVGLSVWAQQKSGAGAKTESGKKHVILPTVYLGQSQFNGGPIKKAEFDRLLKQGLSCHDSMGNKYQVLGFEFNYAERQLYEDSIGNLKVMTDWLTEYCKGDTISPNVSASIYERTKPGDTIFLERIQVAHLIGKGNKYKLDTNALLARSMKCVITK